LPVDLDLLSEEQEAQFLKIGHGVLGPPRQGSIVHHRTVAAHRREVTHLPVTMIGWSLSEMGLTSVMVQEGKVEALLALQGTAM